MNFRWIAIAALYHAVRQFHGLPDTEEVRRNWLYLNLLD